VEAWTGGHAAVVAAVIVGVVAVVTLLSGVGDAVTAAGLRCGDAPRLGHALVSGAHIPVIAEHVDDPQAVSQVTLGARRAQVLIITRQGVVLVKAALLRIAAVGGAGISIVAVRVVLAHARSALTGRVARADALVVTWTRVERVGASIGWTAPIVGAHVLVVTSELGVEDAHARCTVVAQSTRVAVVTGSVLGVEDARAAGA
jgi:hypothetical protein